MQNKKQKVLVIDDDEQILRLLEVIVEDAGFDVASASSAEQGMAKIRNDKYGLILLDIALPDMSGVDMLEYIKKFSPATSVIMITGYDDEEAANFCLENGAHDYITKPFDPEYLQTSILANIS